ncbi:GGDEF domain-containing protein [Candidatus Sumerlaeota bacterium]|nr:GGDEF domain-containing protein [Candidatus Sumerlaeota bacterium]
MHEKTIIDESLIKKLQEARNDRQQPVLMLYDGEEIKNRYTIDKPELVIGRDLTCDIVLLDTKSSRRHARVLYKNHHDPKAAPNVILEDLKSTNGTFVNGAQVEGIHELRDRDKIFIGTTVLGFFVRDESLLKAEQKLIELASTDQLTNLHNRASFDLEVEKEFDRARRYDRDLSLVFFDLDHFKVVNDTYGHPTGDQVLREIGELVIHNARANDIGARYGGEEFAVILPETPLDKAIIKAQRLRISVMDHTFNSQAKGLNITMSIGVSAIHKNMADHNELINLADQALYQAKRSGRNQVWWCGTDGVPQRASDTVTL